MFSSNAQIIHILKNASERMDAHDIYVTGAFDYEVSCYNGLSTLTKKGVIEREKKNGVYHYWMRPDAPIPEHLQDELFKLANQGMPAPPAGRHIPTPRAEYQAASKKEKRNMKERKAVVTQTQVTKVTESVTHTKTTISESESSQEPGSLAAVLPAPFVNRPPLVAVVEPLILPQGLPAHIESTPEPVAAPPVPEPEQPKVLEAPKQDPQPAAEPVKEAKPISILTRRDEEPDYLADLRAQRDRLNADINLAKFLIAMMNPEKRERLAFFLEDHAEIMECAIGGKIDSDGNLVDEFDIKVETERQEAIQFAKTLRTDFSKNSMLDSLVAFMKEFSEVAMNCAAGDDSEMGRRYRRESAEQRNFQALFEAMRAQLSKGKTK